jgi:hypothetical protein
VESETGQEEIERALAKTAETIRPTAKAAVLGPLKRSEAGAPAQAVAAK